MDQIKKWTQQDSIESLMSKIYERIYWLPKSIDKARKEEEEVLTKKITSMSSDGQRQFEVKWKYLLRVPAS